MALGAIYHSSTLSWFLCKESSDHIDFRFKVPMHGTPLPALKEHRGLCLTTALRMKTLCRGHEAGAVALLHGPGMKEGLGPVSRGIIEPWRTEL